MRKFYLTLVCLFLFNTNYCLGAEGGMPQLNPEFWAAQIVWLIFVFFFLYIIIWKLLLPKIADGIENRKMKIMNNLNEAQNFKKEAEKKLLEYQKIIESSQHKAKKILDESKNKLNADIENKKNKFDQEIGKELINVEKQIKNFKKSSLDKINKIAIEISSEVVEQIIGTKANESNVSAIVDDISKKRFEQYS